MTDVKFLLRDVGGPAGERVRTLRHLAEELDETTKKHKQAGDDIGEASHDIADLIGSHVLDNPIKDVNKAEYLDGTRLSKHMTSNMKNTGLSYDPTSVGSSPLPKQPSPSALSVAKDLISSTRGFSPLPKAWHSSGERYVAYGRDSLVSAGKDYQPFTPPRAFDPDKRPDDNAMIGDFLKPGGTDLPILVKAQNVRDYFMDNYERHGWLDMKNFRFVKPPFPQLIVAYNHEFRGQDGTPNIDPEKLLRNATLGIGKVWRGVTVLVTERTLEYFEWYLQPEHQIGKGHITEPRHDRWHPRFSDADNAELQRVVAGMNPVSFIEMQVAADDTKFPARWFVGIDAAGSVKIFENFGWLLIKSPEEDKILSERNISHSMVEDMMCRHGSIALATLSFMNCKNVEIIDNPPNRHERRRAEREGKRPPVTYKTLRIIPLQPRKLSSGQHNPPTHEMPMHIVRGHFKNFKKEGPGLGKYHAHGVYWWPQMVRGNPEKGKVVKDYEVAAPKTKATSA
jgi:hypothetical protein